jgi:dynein heavy chain 1
MNECVILKIHFLYQYALHFFLDIFNSCLQLDEKYANVKDYQQRLGVITMNLFQVCYTHYRRRIFRV